MFSVPSVYFGVVPPMQAQTGPDPNAVNPVISRPPTFNSVPPPGRPMSSVPVPPYSAVVPAYQERPPVTTVFVGNISDKAPDHVIKLMLNKCGNVLNWKRVQGASGKLQAFGFCEYELPESTMRCVRLLNGWKVADKELLVKVDPKTNEQLEEYKRKKMEYQQKYHPTARKTSNTSSLEDEIDDATKEEDEKIKIEMKDIVDEVAPDIQKAMEEENLEEKKMLMARRQDRLEGPKHLTIEDMDLDNERKEIINREIETFRNRHKDDDMDREHREREMRRRYLTEKEKRERDKGRRGGEMSPDYASPMLEESAARGPPHSQQKEIKPSRSRSPAGNRIRHKGANNDSKKSNKEDMDENSIQKRVERKVRQKEASYRERLQRWCAREKHQNRLYEKELQKEREKQREMEIEGQRLLVFLEKYDDEKDDMKFYRGSNLQRRLRSRKSEEISDDHDRQKEYEQLERLREQLMSEDNPEAETILLQAEKKMNEHLRHRLEFLNFDELPLKTDETFDESSHDSIEIDAEEDHNYEQDSSLNRDMADVRNQLNSPPSSSCVLNIADKIKEKVPLRPADAQQAWLAFNQDEQESNTPAEKTKPSTVALEENLPDYEKYHHLFSSSLLAAAKAGDAKAKKTIVETIIEKIPTEKDDLFGYAVLWNYVNEAFVNQKIRPWVDKKINAYVGEDVPSLSQYICEQVAKHCTPTTILQDISMVLDEEAEVFVVKMWRLLIYLVEAKNLGIDS